MSAEPNVLVYCDACKGFIDVHLASAEPWNDKPQVHPDPHDCIREIMARLKGLAEVQR